MAIKFSRHAREQMAERGVSENEVEEAIKGGSKHLQFPNKIVADYKYFSVVYKKLGQDTFIITVKPRW